MIQSAICSTSESRWLLTRTVVSDSLRRCGNCRISRIPAGSSPFVGSSRDRLAQGATVWMGADWAVRSVALVPRTQTTHGCPWTRLGRERTCARRSAQSSGVAWIWPLLSRQYAWLLVGWLVSQRIWMVPAGDNSRDSWRTARAEFLTVAGDGGTAAPCPWGAPDDVLDPIGVIAPGSLLLAGRVGIVADVASVSPGSGAGVSGVIVSMKRSPLVSSHPQLYSAQPSLPQAVPHEFSTQTPELS